MSSNKNELKIFIKKIPTLNSIFDLKIDAFGENQGDILGRADFNHRHGLFGEIEVKILEVIRHGGKGVV